MAGGFHQEQGISVGLPVIQNRAAEGEQCLNPLALPAGICGSPLHRKGWNAGASLVVWLGDHTLLVGIQTRDPVYYGQLKGLQG